MNRVQPGATLRPEEPINFAFDKTRLLVLFCFFRSPFSAIDLLYGGIYCFMCQDYIYDKDMEQIAKDEQRKAWKMQGTIAKARAHRVSQPNSHMLCNDAFIRFLPGAGICLMAKVSVVPVFNPAGSPGPTPHDLDG